MAKIIGAIGSSHIPAIGLAIAKQQQQEPYWKGFFDGHIPIWNWLEEKKPDVAVVFYNDHGLEFFLDKKPTFSIGAAEEYISYDEGWGLATIPPIKGDPDLSWHICNNLVEDEFDISICQELGVDHGLTVPMQLMYPNDPNYGGVKVIPVVINCELHPMPSLKRCYNLGQSIAKAIQSYDKDLDVVIFGTGGLSHQLDGENAGFINKEFDLMCLDKLVKDPEYLFKFSIRDIIENAGAQGVEFNMWMGMRGALPGKVEQLHFNYTIPISNTGAGTLLLSHET
ncbi:MAG: class III extradiol dioxygenase family protein [Hyphomicrobiales bacterium]